MVTPSRVNRPTTDSYLAPVKPGEETQSLSASQGIVDRVRSSILDGNEAATEYLRSNWMTAMPFATSERADVSGTLTCAKREMKS
jgi:hypothetical protein